MMINPRTVSVTRHCNGWASFRVSGRHLPVRRKNQFLKSHSWLNFIPFNLRAVAVHRFNENAAEKSKEQNVNYWPVRAGAGQARTQLSPPV